jgi:uncharacterized protein YjbJ (UPF0337 family)
MAQQVKGKLENAAGKVEDAVDEANRQAHPQPNKRS